MSTLSSPRRPPSPGSGAGAPGASAPTSTRPTTTRSASNRWSKALGVQTFREDRRSETEFATISYWESAEVMGAFTGGDPTNTHHLERDEEFLIELPERVQILRLLTSHSVTGLGRRGGG